MASDRCVWFFLPNRPVWGMTQMTSFECELNTFGCVPFFLRIHNSPRANDAKRKKDKAKKIAHSIFEPVKIIGWLLNC